MKLSNATFSDIGGAVSDLFSSEESAAGLRIKAKGDLAEAQTYDLAAGLARQNEEFEKQSTAIRATQEERQATMALGQERAAIGASGFTQSGSALDILRSSAQQGALAHQLITQQGLINEAGYEEQAKSFDILSAAGKQAASDEQHLASETETFGEISAGVKAISAVASIFIP